MWSGSTALNNIDSALKTVRDDIARLDQNLTRLTESLTENRLQQSKVINEIARVRLQEIDTGQLQETLTAADHDAKKILAERVHKIESLQQETDAVKQQLEQAEQQREVLLASANVIAQELADQEASVQANLKMDANYQAQFERANKAESIADEAYSKSEVAQVDMDKKDEPYQQDKLFMYLWGRKYGTADYEGGVLTRSLDNWVAKLIKYERNRVNYWNLQEIPKRLSAHAEHVKREAEAEFKALQLIENAALADAGVPEILQRLDKARQALDAHDDQIEATENKLHLILEKRASFTAGLDEYMQRSLHCLNTAMQHKDIYQIERYVRATRSLVDDGLVNELRGYRDNYEDNEDDLADLRKAHSVKLSKLKELEGVRRNFKNNRFDDVRSGFGNERLIQSVLSQFVQGVLSGAEVWRVIQRNQRYSDINARPDFGSGGISGRSPRRSTSNSNTTFHWPSNRSGSGGFRMPGGGGGSRRSSNSGGGFRTGGGF